MPIKLLVVLFLFAGFIFALVLIMKKLPGKNTSQKNSQSPSGVLNESTDNADINTTQNLLPIADIKGSALIQRDGNVVSFIKVDCKNYSLLNTSELIQEAESSASVFSSQNDSFKILRLQAPIDSSAHLAQLQKVDDAYERMIVAADNTARGKRLHQQTQFRRELLSRYVESAEAEVKLTSRTKSEVYVCLPVTKGENKVDKAYIRAQDFVQRLKASGFSGKILFDEEIVSLLMLYFGTYRTVKENKNAYAVFPVVKGVNDISAPQSASQHRETELIGDDDDDFFN